MSIFSPRTRLFIDKIPETQLSDLEIKASAIESFQSPRTALELYNTIANILCPFIENNLPSPIRKQENYLLCLKNSPQIRLRFSIANILRKKEESFVVFTETIPGNPLALKRGMVVYALPAGAIDGLRDDIAYEKIYPKQRMPVMVFLGDKKYPIRYSKDDQTDYSARFG